MPHKTTLLGKDICNECAIEVGLTPAMLKKEKRCKTCGKVSMCGKPTMPILRAAPAKPHREPREEGAATCPHCHEEITRLNYSVDTNEYGSVDIDVDNECVGDDYETDGSDSNSDYFYTCPECNEEICSVSDLLHDDENPEVASTGNKDAEVN